MRKTFVCLVIASLLILPTGCGGSTPAPVTTPDGVATPPAPRKISPLAIELVRGPSRIVIVSSLKSAGVPDDVIAATMATLRKGVDDAISGKDIGAILADPELWRPWRDLLVDLLAGPLAEIRINGVQLYDRASAEALISAALDAAANVLRR